jgi:hypothetical protein
MSTTAGTTQFDFSVGDPITMSPPVPGQPSRGLARYMLAICIGVAATLAWQAYGQATKQMIAAAGRCRKHGCSSNRAGECPSSRGCADCSG